MSTAYRRRKKLIAQGKWSFAAQTERQRKQFHRHLTPAERQAEILHGIEVDKSWYDGTYRRGLIGGRGFIGVRKKLINLRRGQG